MATAELEARVHDEAGTAVIELTGDVDRDAEAALDAAYGQVGKTESVVLDFAGVDYINRTGIFLCRYSECPASGTLRLGSTSSSTTNNRNFSAKITSTSTWQAKPWAGVKTTLGADYTNAEFDGTSASGTTLPAVIGALAARGFVAERVHAVREGDEDPAPVSEDLGAALRVDPRTDYHVVVVWTPAQGRKKLACLAPLTAETVRAIETTIDTIVEVSNRSRTGRGDVRCRGAERAEPLADRC